MNVRNNTKLAECMTQQERGHVGSGQHMAPLASFAEIMSGVEAERRYRKLPTVYSTK